MRSTVLNALHRLMKLGFDVRRSEVASVAWSFCYFFFLLSSYYVLRPLRDEMGIQGGVENLPWMFTGTFLATLIVVPIFGSIASNVPRRRIAPAFYGFFLLVLLGFYGLLVSDVYPRWVAVAFFIWISVFNLFVVSVFWSFMVDVFSSDQSERLFGFVAAGGDNGRHRRPRPRLDTAPAGWHRQPPADLRRLALGNTSLYLRDPSEQSRRTGRTVLGEKLEGHGTYWWEVLGRIRFLVRVPLPAGDRPLHRALLVDVHLRLLRAGQHRRGAIGSSARRTQVFALIDFAVNSLTLACQLFVTGRLTDRFGPGPSLVSLPLVTVLGFLALGLSPILITLIVFQVLRRASNYALSKPARETLFSPLTDTEKYKGKNIVDTLIYRAVDAASGWVFAGFQAFGLPLTGIALVGAGFAIGWVVLCGVLVRSYNNRREEETFGKGGE